MTLPHDGAPLIEARALTKYFGSVVAESVSSAASS